MPTSTASTASTASTPNASAATVVHAAQAEFVEMPRGGFQLLADASQTRGILGANRLNLTSGADGAKPHFHTRSTEVFYVLGGAIEFLLGESLLTVSAGGLVVVPPNLPHAFGAVTDLDADLLILITPGVERFEYFRRLQRIALGIDQAESLVPDQDQYDVHFLESPAWSTARTSHPGP